MVAVIVAALLIGIGTFVYFRIKRTHRAEVTAIAQVSLSDRDRQMAPFHVRRFTDAIEQSDRPEQIPELTRNLRYWQAVAAAEEMRP